MKIELTQDQTSTIDSCDADLAALRWFASLNPKKAAGRQFYVVRKIPLPNSKPVTQYLHRVVLGRVLGREMKRGEHVDHINGDGLDGVELCMSRL